MRSLCHDVQRASLIRRWICQPDALARRVGKMPCGILLAFFRMHNLALQTAETFILKLTCKDGMDEKTNATSHASGA